MLPTDGGGSSTTAPVETVLARSTAYALLNACVGTASDALGFGTNVTIALLTGAPTVNVSNGTFDISGVELTNVLAPGYARVTLTRATAFDVPAGAAPAIAPSKLQVMTPMATANWPAIMAVALIDGTGKVMAWRALVSAVYVLKFQAARIPVGGLKFYTPSA